MTITVPRVFSVSNKKNICVYNYNILYEPSPTESNMYMLDQQYLRV